MRVCHSATPACARHDGSTGREPAKWGRLPCTIPATGTERRGVDKGLILGRYRPLADLGEGGHGTVTLAFDTKMARRVAVKRIPLSRAGVRRLDTTTGLAEARTSAMLNHPGIVTVHEWDTDSDEAFLIMEHVDGASLAELLDVYAPLDPDEASAILEPICSAMAYAHDNGVLHLDLKPENVLITRAGLVKVGDFGVASLTNAAGQAISAGGTLGYMPSEQLRGEPVDVRTDVWALAALAYEVLCDAVPFASDSYEGAVYKAEYVEPPAPSEFVEGLAPQIDDVLLAALAPDRADRPGSVSEFACELLPWLGDPAQGREGLAEMVAEIVAEDEPGAHEGFARLGLWDRLLPAEPVMRRIAAAIACAWLSWSGLAALGLGPVPSAGATLVVAAAAALVPPAGLAVGAILFAAGAFALAPLAGLAAAIGGAAWWLAAGRARGWAGIAPVFAPLFGAAGVAPALPILIGFWMPGSWLAPAAGAAAGLVTALAAAASGSSAPFLRVTPAFLSAPLGTGHPVPIATLTSALVLAAGWALAAGAMSLAARGASRVGAFGGAAVACLATLAAVGPWVTGGQRLDASATLQVGLSLILVTVVVALGPPVAAEDDT